MELLKPNELEAEATRLRGLLETAGVKASSKILGTSKGAVEVEKSLEPESIIPWANKGGNTYLYNIGGVVASYPKPEMPKGSYKLVANQSNKDAEKGGLGWAKVN